MNIDDLTYYVLESVKDRLPPEVPTRTVVQEPVPGKACITVTFVGPNTKPMMSYKDVADLHAILAKLCWKAGYDPSIVIVG